MNESRIPTSAQIASAKEAHALGYYDLARERVRHIPAFPVETFSNISPDEQKQVVTAAQIHVKSSIASANEQWDPDAVAKELRRAKHVIKGIYEDPQVKKTASEMDARTSVEMSRDKINYTLTLAALTGNPVLLEDAIAGMNAIIDEAQDPTVKAHIVFDRQQLEYRRSPDIASFEDLTTAFDDAAAAFLDAKNWEMLATISAQYLLDAEQQEGNLMRNSCVRALYNRAVRRDGNLAGTIEIERQKEERQASWKSTNVDNIDYSYLTLRTARLYK